jgi:hypothetical protein
MPVHRLSHAAAVLAVAALPWLGCKRDTSPSGPAPAASTALPAASAPASSSAPPPAPSFGVVAFLPPDGRLLPGSDHAFLVAGDQLYRIDARGILQDIALLRGIPPGFHDNYWANTFLGSFPDAFWAQNRPMGSRKAETYRWAAGRWGRVSPLEEGESLLSVVLLGKKRAVGLATGDQGRLRLIRGNDQSNPPSPLTEIPAPPSSASASASAPPPAEPPASAPSPPAVAPSASVPASASASSGAPAPPASAPAVERRPSRLRNGHLDQRRKEQNAQGQPSGEKSAQEPARALYGTEGRPMAGLPSGHLFVIGVDGELTSKRVLVERWNAQGRSVVDELPEADEPLAGELGIVAAAPDDAYAFSIDHGSYLARLEGSSWKREKVPNNLVIHDMLAPGDGSYYLATEGPLFRREKGATAWTEVPLPQCGEVFSLALVDGKLWAVGKQHGDSLALFGPEPPTTPVFLPRNRERSVVDELPSWGTEQQRRLLVRQASSPFCQKNFVLLRSQVSPGAKAFPDVEAVLRQAIPLDGVELVTEQSPQWTYLGARVPSYEIGQRLVKYIAKNPANLEGKLFCHEPQVAKTFPLAP